MKLDIKSLEKAVLSLKTAINQVQALPASDSLKETARDGVIQRFEYTFELSWKMMKRFMEMYMAEKLDELAAKDLFRKGVEAGLIEDSVKWFYFREARNKTSHIYDQAIAEEVYKAAVDFLPRAEGLARKLKERV